MLLKIWNFKYLRACVIKCLSKQNRATHFLSGWRWKESFWQKNSLFVCTMLSMKLKWGQALKSCLEKFFLLTLKKVNVPRRLTLQVFFTSIQKKPLFIENQRLHSLWEINWKGHVRRSLSCIVDWSSSFIEIHFGWWWILIQHVWIHMRVAKKYMMDLTDDAAAVKGRKSRSSSLL